MPKALQGFRSSPQQNRLYSFVKKRDMYGAGCCLYIKGSVSVPRLKHALERLSQQQEMLHTSLRYHVGQGSLMQVTQDAHCNELLQIDMCAPSEQEVAVLCDEIMQQWREPTTIHITQGPFLRFTLVQTGNEKALLFVTTHALYMDQHALEVIMPQIVACYDEDSTSENTRTDQAIHYAQFAQWQQDLLGAESTGTAFWHQHFTLERLAAAARPLPFIGENSKSKNFQPGVQVLMLAPERVSQIEQLCTQTQCSWNAFFFACWNILLWRLTGQEAVASTLEASGRTVGELENALGLYAKNLPLITPLEASTTCIQVFTRCQSAIEEVLQWQDYFSWPIHIEDADDTLDHYPYSFASYHLPLECQIEDIRFGYQSGYSCIEPYTLKVVVVRKEDTVSLEIHYASNLLMPADVQLVVRSWDTLLEQIVLKPRQAIGDIDMLAQSGPCALLSQPDQSTTGNEDSCIHVLFTRQVLRNPEAIALCSGEEQITYQELERRANQFARYMQVRGIGIEQPVGICLERSINFLVSIFGILKAGATYVPLDPAYPRERLSYIVHDTQMRMQITSAQVQQDKLPTKVETIVLEHAWTQIAQHASEPLVTSVQPANLAYVIYTSGTTGVPKGVMVSHRGLGNLGLAQGASFKVDHTSRVLQFASPSFDASVSEILMTLLCGGTLCLASRDDLMPGPGLMRLLTEQAITHVTLPPAVLAVLPAAEQCSSLSTIIVAGEASTADLLSTWSQGRTLYNAYGPTEATVCSSIGRYTNERRPDIGLPLAQTQMYILDKHWRLAPIGAAGEIYIGGIGLARGYFQRPEITAERFIPHPFRSDGERLYRTGDIACQLPSGKFCYLGRTDNQVKIRGYRVELEEIEIVLGQHRDVQQCAVHLREDTPGDKRLIAYIVASKQQSFFLHLELRKHLQDKLPEYMQPTQFVFLAAFPLMPNGKVNRRDLSLLAVPHVSVQREITQAVSSPVEEVLVGLWQDILEYEEIQIHDNFFMLGGHSLLATQLLARIYDIFQVEVPINTFLQAPTIAQLSELIGVRLESKQRSLVPALVPVARDQVLPLSFAQQRLWFFDQLEGGSIAYNIATHLSIDGPLNLQQFEQCILILIERHEILRTHFAVEGGQPQQVIDPVGAFHLPVLDLTLLGGDAGEQAVLLLVEDDRLSAFDLLHGPLLRCNLVHLCPEKYIVLLSMHHSISDGKSIEIFMRELFMLYAAQVQGETASLLALPLQYVDFAHWQRSWLQGEVLQQQLDYWQQCLADLKPLELTTDFVRPAFQRYQGNVVQIDLAVAVSEQCKQLCRQEGITLFMFLLAAWLFVLGYWNGQKDIAVGTPIANRNRTELEGMIGFFVNTLVLRCQLEKQGTVRDLMRQVREMCLSAYAHQDVPFERLVELLQPERDLARSPLFQVMFSLQQATGGSDLTSLQTLADLEIRFFAGQHTTTKFDLSLAVGETQDGLQCQLHYNVELFTQATAHGLLKCWQQALLVMLEQPTLPLAQISLLTDTDREHLQGWNTTATTWPDARPFDELITAQAECFPDAIALQMEEQHLTYAMLELMATGLASQLQVRGLQAQQPVALCVERSLEGVIAIVGIWKAGGCLLPLDPSAPPERLFWILHDTQAALVIVQHQFADLLAPLHLQLLDLALLWSILPGAASTFRPCQHSIDDLAYLMYTSGSTGQPKGVMVAQRAILNRLWWGIEDVDLQANDRVLQIAAWTFDIALWEIVAPLLVGATTVLLSEAQARDSTALLTSLDSQQVTIAHLVPSLLKVLLLEASREQCQTLRYLQCGGETVTQNLVSHAQEILQVPVHQFYGPTEAAISVTCWRSETQRPDQPINIGQAIANTQLYVLDQEGQLVVPGMRGELYIGGSVLAWGYWQRMDLTAERFVPDPFSTQAGARLYRTGDLVRTQEDGQLVFLGRNDEQIKIRGHRVEPAEVERELLALSIGTEVLVVAAKDHREEPCLLAYIVGADLAYFSDQALRSRLRARLPEYMIPATFISLEALPLNTHGKVDRRRLPAPNWTRKGQASTSNVWETRSPLEALVLECWAELLGVPQVGLYDNFFALGGHSLLATQLVARLRTLLHIEIPLRSLFASPTVASLTAELQQRLQVSTSHTELLLLPAPRTAFFPLSYAQQRLWFLAQLDPASTAYTIAGRLLLRGSLNPQAWAHGLRHLIERQESLRTLFPLHNQEPYQLILPTQQAGIETGWIDLSALPQDQQEPLCLLLGQQEQAQPFVLEKGPLLRLWLIRLAAQEHLLLLSLHHIIADGWSLGILLRELAASYQAALQQHEPDWSPLSIQYADYAVWQRQWLQGTVLQEQLDYWQQQLADLAPLDLPTDFLRPALQRHRGALLPFQFSLDLSTQLKLRSQQEEVTLFMFLLAGWHLLLSRWSQQSDIAVGTPIANRTRTEVEGVIGFFVNTLVLRCQLEDQWSVHKLVQHVRTLCLEAYAHQDVPFERLVEMLQPERDLARSPLFQVMFSLQSAPSEQITLPGLTVVGLASEQQTAKFDLTLTISETSQGCVGSLEYNTDLFRPETMQHLLAQWERLLQAMVDEAQTPLWRLSLLDAQSHALLLQQSHGDPLVMHPLASGGLVNLFAEQVRQCPDRIAIVDENQQVSYEVLSRHAALLAQRLRARAVGPEVAVGLCLPRRVELVIGILGVLQVGGYYVPLDGSWPQERWQWVWQDAGISLLVGEAPREFEVPSDAQIPIPQQIDEDEIATLAAETTYNLFSEEQGAYLIYTSGSTGRPKGMIITQRNLMALLQSGHQQLGTVGDQEIWSLVHSEAFDFSVWELWGALSRGARLVVVPREVAQSGQEWGEWIMREAVTVLNQTPTGFQQWQQGRQRADQTGDAVRWLLFGGEALAPQRLHDWYKQRGEHTRVVNLYGITETTVHVSWHELSREEVQGQGGSVIGRPLAGWELYVLDEHMTLAPIGVRGEFYVGGAGVGRGYGGRPELTAEHFVPHPWSAQEGARLYRTGDLGRWLPDGNLEYLGRRDGQVKVRGYRIELREIEAVLKEHPAVRDATVLLHPMHSSEPQLCAYIIIRPEYTLSTRDLRSYAQQRLPEYMLPPYFIQLTTFPLTVNGKLDYKALLSQSLIDEESQSVEVEVPNPLEQLLIDIWSKLLENEQIGIHDNFFHRGGHSLLATRLQAQVRDLFQVDIPVRRLFEAPTVAEFALVVQEYADEMEDQEIDELLLAIETFVPEQVTDVLAVDMQHIMENGND